MHVYAVVCHKSMHANHEMRGKKGEKGRLALDWMLYIGGADLICMAWQDSTEM